VTAACGSVSSWLYCRDSPTTGNGSLWPICAFGLSSHLDQEAGPLSWLQRPAAPIATRWQCLLGLTPAHGSFQWTNRGMMTKLVALAVMAAFTGQYAEAREVDVRASFAGDWSIVYSCENATGAYAERCRQGARDGFYLYKLTQEGRTLCGYHLATGQMGNRIDDGSLSGEGPSIHGTIRGKTAEVEFRSGRTGEVGRGTLTRNGDTLVWHVTRPLKTAEQNWIPSDAVLQKSASKGPPYLRGCSRG